MKERHRSDWIESIFAAAVELPPGERRALLAEACNGDDTAREEVEALLNADENVARRGFMAGPACEAAWTGLPAEQPWLDAAGQRVGSYQIVRLIATGGMGSVYEAVQDRPRRTVALKIMRSAVASASELRRFEYESELLGRLRHPAIAQIYEAGVHREGGSAVPYFAMELVPDAETLVDYAASRGLADRTRLELFASVCDAVQHGHQRGIIHRDLKPGNILVDAAGQPKIIDFGVALAIDAGMPSTLRTDMREMAGTLQYMSPEQLRGDASEMDVRSDVYALGVVLYELLAETLPYDLSGRSLGEAIRTIEEARWRPLGHVRRCLSGDIETIVARAMSLEKDRRYASAGELAADVRRLLANEPIAARPDSTLYVLRKFAARNRALVAGVALAAAGLIVGSSVAVWQAVDATRERNRAVTAARQAERINGFLTSLLWQADPNTHPHGLTVREVLDRASANAEAELSGEPAVLASVLHQLGCMYVRLGRNEEGQRLLQRTVELLRGHPEIDCPELPNVLIDLAWAYDCEDVPDARMSTRERLFREAWDIQRARHGEASRESAIVKGYVADCMAGRGLRAEAIRMMRESILALENSSRKPDAELAFARSSLAILLNDEGQHAAAESICRRALTEQEQALGREHGQVEITLRILASILQKLERQGEADDVQARADAIRMKLRG